MEGAAWRRKTIYHMHRSTLQCPADRHRLCTVTMSVVPTSEGSPLESRSISELSATLNSLDIISQKGSAGVGKNKKQLIVL